jgi:hypothetical protein
VRPGKLASSVAKKAFRFLHRRGTRVEDGGSAKSGITHRSATSMGVLCVQPDQRINGFILRAMSRRLAIKISKRVRRRMTHTRSRCSTMAPSAKMPWDDLKIENTGRIAGKQPCVPSELLYRIQLASSSLPLSPPSASPLLICPPPI